MNKHEILHRLYDCFPHSFLNDRGEFIAHRQANEYFNFENCQTLLDVQCKVIEWFSRGAYKSQPFTSNFKNAVFNDFMRAGINAFLETDFTIDDMEIIYTYLGNAIKHQKTVEFIESGYKMTFFNQFKKQPSLF